MTVSPQGRETGTKEPRATRERRERNARNSSYGYTRVATYGDCDNRIHRSMVDILHEERLDMKDAEYEAWMHGKGRGWHPQD